MRPYKQLLGEDVLGFSQKLIAFLFTFLFIPDMAAAETLYVSDQLIITLRRGKSSSHKILTTLKTGAPLEVLEKAEGDEYVKVRTSDGIEGYVLLEFIVTKTGAVMDPVVIEAKPPGIFDRAAINAALKFKYKPKVVNGEPIDVAGVRNLITFELAD